MKRLAMLCALAALTGCAEAETTGEAENQAELAAAEAAVAPWALEAGTYEYSRSDGKRGVNTMAADGTLSNAVTGGAVETGTWAQEGNLGCFVPASGEKRCYTFTAPDAEGNFTGVTTDGITATVRETA